MKKTFLRFASAVTAVCMVGSGAVVAFAFTPADILRKIDTQRRDEFVPNAEADASSRICSYYINYEFAGIALTTDDPNALIAAAPTTNPITWSDNYWPSYYYLSHTEHDFLLQPIEGYAAEFGRYIKYENIMHGMSSLPEGEDTECTLDSAFSMYDMPVYLLSSKTEDIPEMAEYLAGEPNVTVIGAVYGAAYTDVLYDSVISRPFIKYQDGSYSYGDIFTGLTCEEALAKCSELAEANENIAYVCPTGYIPEIMENKNGVIELVPIVHFGSGDLNASSTPDLTDAVLLARAAGGTYQLSAEARAEADLNADGEVDQADLSMLLSKLAGL